MALRAALACRVVIVSKVKLVQLFVLDGDNAMGVYHNVVETEVMDGADDVVEFMV
jgi:hypothetical protein